MIYLGIEILQGCTFVTDGLRILGVLVGSQDFATHFLNEVLCQDLVHINNFPLLGDAHVALGILSSYVAHRPSYLTRIVPPSFMFLLAGFDKKIMQVCEDIMGPGSWEFFQGPLVRHQVQLPISFGGMGLFSMEDYASLLFQGVALQWLHICALSFIFLTNSSWRNMIFKLKGAHTCFNHVYM